jgi:hypothetical protein
MTNENAMTNQTTRKLRPERLDSFIEGIASFPGCDFNLHFDHRAKIWTASVETDDKAIAIGRGKSIVSAIQNMIFTDPQPPGSPVAVIKDEGTG